MASRPGTDAFSTDERYEVEAAVSDGETFAFQWRSGGTRIADGMKFDYRAQASAHCRTASSRHGLTTSIPPNSALAEQLARRNRSHRIRSGALSVPATALSEPLSPGLRMLMRYDPES